MKTPPKQLPDTVAHDKVEKFLQSKARGPAGRRKKTPRKK
jgi:hypothetical protein